MFVFAEQWAPSLIVEAAKSNPAYWLAFVLAALVVHLYWKDFAMREENKLHRDDANEQRMLFVGSMDKIADKV